MDKVVEYYDVVVKCEQEKGYNEKTGKTTYKKFNESYLVHAGSPEAAAKAVEKEMSGVSYSWRVYSVKESKISGILDALAEK